MSWIDLLGYAASASVLLTFCMSTMVPLRIVAICSNLLFATFGASAHIYPVLVLHVVLLPVNVGRLVQILSLLRNIRSAEFSEVPIQNFLHLMSRRFMKSGQTLINKGEKAERLYYLASGTMRIPELGKVIAPGALLGEIGVFASNKMRMATVVCVDDCEVYEMSESTAKQLYFQDRTFGLAVLQLIISRLTENMRLQEPAGRFEEKAPAPCELSTRHFAELIHRV
jgi:CRP/FNR family transcriptional regulator, cyclic AMP receptor protein